MKRIFTVLMLLVFQIGILEAQISGTEAYVLGNGVQIGISGKGGFEGADTTIGTMPAGTHFRSNTQYFGIVANPQNNNWASFNGDYFSPGTPENGWGLSLGTSASDASNNCTQVFDIPGSITNYSVNHGYINVDWEGTDAVGGTNLDVKINFLLKETDLFYTTTVSVTNNTSATIPQLYYYRNIDPDNNIMINGSNYATLNTVVSQPGTGGHDIAKVSATQSSPWDSYMALAAEGANWRASYGGFSNRAGSAIWNGTGFTQTVGSSDSADIAIQLSYLIQNLAPGATETFNFITMFSNSIIPIYGNLLYFTFPGTSHPSMTACSTCADTVSTCGGTVPIVITGATANEYSWVWSPASGLSVSTGDSVIANPSVTTMYTVIGTPLDTSVIADTLTIVVKDTPGASVGITASVNPICSGTSTILTGSGATSYSWNNGLGTINPVSVMPVTATIYSVTGTDINGCTATADIGVNVINTSVSISASADLICAGTSTTLTASGANTYSWSYGLGTNNPVTVTPTSVSIYTVTGTDTNGCTGSANITINIVPTAAAPYICMVTTDSSTFYKYNDIYWDNTLYNNVDSFIVYRMNVLTSTYLRIGAVSANALSEFTDTAQSIGGPNGGNPMYSSWLYKLAIRDTCGNISGESPYHQTMFVQESGPNFSWNAYTIETGQTNPVIGYAFLRDDNNTGNWHVLVNTAGLASTDPNYTSYPNGNWRVDALGFDCTPSMLTSTHTYLKSHSNTIKPAPMGIVPHLLNAEQIAIYPNPANEYITIENFVFSKGQTISVYDIQGQLLLQQPMLQAKTNINITTISNGVYFLKVENEKGVVAKKFVKE